METERNGRKCEQPGEVCQRSVDLFSWSNGGESCADAAEAKPNT